LKSRGFDGSEKEVDLLLRGGSIPPLIIFLQTLVPIEDTQACS
ncbi:endonuclease, partial [Escherichia sp. HC-CC]